MNDDAGSDNNQEENENKDDDDDDDDDDDVNCVNRCSMLLGLLLTVRLKHFWWVHGPNFRPTAVLNRGR